MRIWIGVFVLVVGCTRKQSASESAEPTPAPAQDPGAKEQHLAEARWNAEAETPTEREPQTEPTGSTAEEFAAWDREDPVGEKHLRQWDKDNYAALASSFHDLQCFEQRVVERGEALYAGKTKGDWDQFARAYVHRLDAWQKTFFATHPQAFEQSKLAGNFLELHDLVMVRYLRAYTDADGARLDKAKALFAKSVAKIKRYASALGKPLDDATPAHCEGLKLP